MSEGGFKENKVSKAALLGVEEASDKKGKPYYKYELLTTTGTVSHYDILAQHRNVEQLRVGVGHTSFISSRLAGLSVLWILAPAAADAGILLRSRRR